MLEWVEERICWSHCAFGGLPKLWPLWGCLVQAVQRPFLLLLLLLFFKFIFIWRIIALQRCVGFCCTTTWISPKYAAVVIHSVVSGSMRPHGLQHTRPPCPSPAPGACSNSCPSSQWCHPVISSSVVSSSCPHSFPASGSFPMNQLFASGGPSFGASASASVLLMNIQTDFL